MTEFQIILLAVTGFFIFKVFDYMRNFEPPTRNRQRAKEEPVEPSLEEMIENADTSYENGDIQTALELLENANRHSPNDCDILNKFAYILAKDNQIDRAIQEYNNSIAVNDSDDLVHNAIASLYKEQKLFEKAKEHYEKAIEIDPEYEIVYYNYANMMQDMQKTEEAKELYKKAVELNSDFQEAKIELEKLENS